MIRPSGRTGQPSEDFCHPHEQRLQRITSAGTRIVAARTPTDLQIVRSPDRLRSALCETRYIALETEADWAEKIECKITLSAVDR
jgi:hypothetical protein